MFVVDLHEIELLWNGTTMKLHISNYKGHLLKSWSRNTVDYGSDLREKIEVEEGQRLVISFEVKREDVGSEIIGDEYFGPVTHFKFSKPLVDKWSRRSISSGYLRWQPTAIIA